MSIRIMTAVWDRGKRYEGGMLLVLLALADWADDGGRCFPSVPQIAEKSRLTERQVYRVLGALKADGVLCASPQGRGRRTVYHINTEMLSGNRATNAQQTPKDGSVTPDKTSGVGTENPEIMSGFPEPQNPDICGTKPLTSASPTPDICDIPPHPPLGRTVKEPSEGTVKEPLSLPSRQREGKEKLSAATIDATSFGRFRQALKFSLGGAPLTHSNFREVKAGQHDFDACFRDWWLADSGSGNGGTGPPRVVTESGDAAATAQGLSKYRKRIEGLARQHFGAVVEFVVQELREQVQ